MKSWFKIQNAADAKEATVYVYNDIGMYGVSAHQFATELDAITAPVINVRINSYGGEVFDGFAMFNALQRHPSKVVAWVDGIAASAATLPLMASEEIHIASNGFVMIHNPLVLTIGNADELRHEAEVLEALGEAIAKLYIDRTGKDAATVKAWMDKETWFGATEAEAAGFADVIDGESADVPETPQNKAGLYWNTMRPAAEKPSARVKALGLQDLLKPAAPPPTPKPATHAPVAASNALISAATPKAVMNPFLAQLKGHTK